MPRLFRKFLKDRDGAIAVETAVITPILMLILLPAVDLGLQVFTLQKMSQSADSGVEYLVNGGRDEPTLRNIMQDSYGETIATQDLIVQASCGCLVTGSGEDGSSDNSSTGNEPGTTEPNPQEPVDPYAGYYTKTATTLSEEMCPAVCSDGSIPSALINVHFSQNVAGVWKSKTISTHLQTRVQ